MGMVLYYVVYYICTKIEIGHTSAKGNLKMIYFYKTLYNSAIRKIMNKI